MAGTILAMRKRDDDESCECYSCGVLFASNILPRRREDGGTFYCPNGHGQSYTESEADKLRKQLTDEKLKREQAERDMEWARVAERKADAARAKVEKKLRLQTRRIEAGVCPHCQRTFKQLAAHMKCKHAAILAQKL